MQLCQGTCHRQPELGARAQPRVTGNGAMDTKVDASREPPVGEKTGGELDGTVGIGPDCRDPVCQPGFDQERRRRDRGSQPTEAPSQLSPQVQHAEVQSRRRFDENVSAIGHTGSGAAWPPARAGLPSCRPVLEVGRTPRGSAPAEGGEFGWRGWPPPAPRDELG